MKGNTTVTQGQVVPSKILTFEDLEIGEAFVSDGGVPTICPVFIKTTERESFGIPGWHSGGATKGWEVKRVDLDITYSVLE